MITTPVLRWARPVRALLISVAMVMAIAVDAFAQLHTVPYVSGLSAPLEFVQDPSSPSVQFVVEQSGRIRVIQNGTLLPTPFLDLSGVISFGGEQGLLGLAFSPDYAVSRRFFVDFTDQSGNTVVARFKRSTGNPLVADPSARFDLRWNGGQRYIVQPFANHNGGHLAFGPDGYLYIGMGDGGSGGDPLNNAQRPDTLLGKLLRINVMVADQNPEGYVVPSDNPFVHSAPTLPEIWAFGLRNPWKFTFDDPALGGTGAMLIGDVGQGAYEEVDYQPPNTGGRNYGWRVFEGAHSYNPTLGPAYLPLVGPIAEYDHTVGNSITGGFVYRGSSLGAFYRGRYFYADWGTARVWSIALIPAGNGGVTASAPIEHTGELGGSGAVGNISSFGVDAAGELYMVSYSSGQILKVATLSGPGSPLRGGFDGDGRTDLAVYRPSEGGWYIRFSSTGYSSTGWAFYQWGVPGDVRITGDFDGDGRTDLAVYRPSEGGWYIRFSSTGYSSTGWAFYQWGVPGDVPIAGDFDGDGRTDLAVYRPTEGGWYIHFSTTGYSPTGWAFYQWGVPGDIPLTGDFDGDGRTDLAVYRPSEGGWYIRFSATGYNTWAYYQWGVPGDVAIARDFDGDGRADLAVYRPSEGGWYVRFSSTGYSSTGWAFYQWGVPGDVPIAGDFDGDGRTDLAVFRPSEGGWYIRFSTTGYNTWAYYQWGVPGDVP